MRVVVFGALNSALAMGLGAFGAHILGGQIQAADPQAFETAVIFHLIVSVSMIAMGGLKGHVLPTLMGVAGWFLGLGIVLFAGGIYAAALNAPDFVTTVVPIGGILIILGYLALGVASARRV